MTLACRASWMGTRMLGGAAACKGRRCGVRCAVLCRVLCRARWCMCCGGGSGEVLHASAEKAIIRRRCWRDPWPAGAAGQPDVLTAGSDKSKVVSNIGQKQLAHLHRPWQKAPEGPNR